MNVLRRTLCLTVLLAVLCGAPSAWAANDQGELFKAAAAALLSPAEEALATGAYALRLGDTAYVPAVAPEITPYDKADSRKLPAVEGGFESSDEGVVSVDESGVMTARAEGTATVTYHAPTGDIACAVTVSREATAELAKAMAYVAKREFYAVKRARLPKYNKYAKWYYGKKKEVGWCSVFTIWCANASGNNPLKDNDAPAALAPSDVIYFREGQVGNQYDAFFTRGRFGGIPRVGYTVIYAEMNNAYRTTHIGLVTDVQARGDGLYRVTTVEGNMSNSVKSYCYLYDSNKDNHLVGTEKGLKLQYNMSELPADEQTDPLEQYDLHTDHWSVFGFGMSWLPAE